MQESSPRECREPVEMKVGTDVELLRVARR
jgi:hypothetical protein